MPTRNSVALAPEALHDFDSVNPLGFSLYDDEGEQQIYILNDQSPGRTHHLVLYNNTDKDLAFQPPVGRLPSAVNHHLELRFRPGTLDPEYLSWLSVGTGGWRLATSVEAPEAPDAKDEIHDGTVSLYLLFVGEEDLVLKRKGTQVIILNHVKAGVPGGSRGSRMELRYHTNGAAIIPALEEEQLHVRQERLQIINHRGKKELPMLAAFEGHSTVLNNGDTENHLVLQISNYLQNSAIPLNARDSESPTKFILSFDTSEEQAAWALCDGDNAAAIDVEMHFEAREGVDWHIRPELQGNNPQWIITTHDDVPVEVGQFFHLHLDGLKTSMPSGFTTLYLLYQNIPGFWDGRFEIPIEKSPLKFADEKKEPDHRKDGSFIQKTKVGIGNLKPGDTLDVNGGILAKTLTLKNATKEILIKEEDEEGNEVEKLKEFSYKELNFPALDVDGKINSVGVKISKPSDGTPALETAGDAKIEGKMTTSDLEVTGTLTVTGTLADSLGTLLPKGAIIMWSGKNVPEGWVLCDGSENTPDLQGRFIVGYDSSKPPTPTNAKKKEINYGKIGNSGGENDHRLSIEEMPAHGHSIKHGHSIQDPGHSHRVYANHKTNGGDGLDDAGNAGGYWGKIESNTTGISVNDFNGNSGNTGNNQAHENRPPYYVLAFIMKK